MCYNKISNLWNYCNCSKTKRNILKTWNILKISFFCSILQQDPCLSRFKFPKLTYRKKDCQLATYLFKAKILLSVILFTCKACAPRSFCLSRYSNLIGCFNIVLRICNRLNTQSCGKNFDMVGKLFLSSHFHIEEWTILENKLFMLFISFWKQTAVWLI